MATVPNILRNAAPGAFFPAAITLGTSGDTYMYTQGSNQELVLFNTDTVSNVVTLKGAAATTAAFAGVGDTVVNVSSGYTISVPAAGFAVVLLDKLSAYHVGAISIQASTAAKVKAIILQ